jgi:hypothetical protein
MKLRMIRNFGEYETLDDLNFRKYETLDNMKSLENKKLWMI